MKIDLIQNDRLVLKGTTKIISSVLCLILLGLLAVCLAVAVSDIPAGWIAALSVGFLGGGILWMVYHKTEIVFDRAARTVTLEKHMLHGRRKEVISLSNVRQADVDLKRNQRSNNRLHPSYTYRLCLMTGGAQDQNRVPLSHGYTTNKRHLVTARKINAWLGVPEAPIAAGPSMEDIAQVLTSLGFGKSA